MRTKEQVLQCRLCLRNRKSMVSIFSENVDNGCSVHEVIEDLLNFKVWKTDGFSQYICGDCCSKVMGYKSFKSMCLKSKEISWRKAMETAILNGVKITSVVSMDLPHHAINDSVCSSEVVEKNGCNLIGNCVKEEHYEEVYQQTNDLEQPGDNVQPSGSNSAAKTEPPVEEQEDNNSMSSNSTLIRCDESENYLGSVEDLEQPGDTAQSPGWHAVAKSEVNRSKPPIEDQYDNNTMSSDSTLIRCNKSECLLESDEESIRLRLTSSDDEISDHDEHQEEILKDLKELSMKRKSTNTPDDYPMMECRVILTRCDAEKYNASHHNSNRYDKYVPEEIVETEYEPDVGTPYACGDCWLTFSSWPFFKRHRKHHHGDLNPDKVEYISSNYGESCETSSRKGRNIGILSEANRQVINKMSVGGLKHACDNDSTRSESIETLRKITMLGSKVKYRKSEKRSSIGSLFQKAVPIHQVTKVNKPLLGARIVNEAPVKDGEDGNEELSKLDSIQSSYREHLSTQGKGTKVYECLKCHKVLQSKTSLRLHMYIHDGIKPFNCSICNRSFRTKALKVRHETIHFDFKPYPCPRCPRRYRHIYVLEKHMQVHSNYKPHKCEECGKAFLRVEYLRKHERMHTGEQPYKCKFCPRTFAVLENLSVHIRTHSGERPYQCKDCGRRFNVNSTLKTHIKRVHTKTQPM